MQARVQMLRLSKRLFVDMVSRRLSHFFLNNNWTNPVVVLSSTSAHTVYNKLTGDCRATFMQAKVQMLWLSKWWFGDVLCVYISDCFYVAILAFTLFHSVMRLAYLASSKTFSFCFTLESSGEIKPVIMPRTAICLCRFATRVPTDQGWVVFFQLLQDTISYLTIVLAFVPFSLWPYFELVSWFLMGCLPSNFHPTISSVLSCCHCYIANFNTSYLWIAKKIKLELCMRLYIQSTWLFFETASSTKADCFSKIPSTYGFQLFSFLLLVVQYYEFFPKLVKAFRVE
jgi:hypothetical protein